MLVTIQTAQRKWTTYVRRKVTIKNCYLDSSDTYGKGVVHICDSGEGSIVGGIVGSVSRESGNAFLQISDCQTHVEIINDTDSDKSAGIIYEAGNVTKIDNCRVYSPLAGHGICATKAYSITNCFDGTVKGREKFGSVVDGGTMKNNYCVEKKDSSITITEEPMPSDVTKEKVYALNSKKISNNNFELYAIYADSDDNVFSFSTGMKVKIDPETMTCFYNDYKTNDNRKDVDNKFETYIANHLSN